MSSSLNGNAEEYNANALAPLPSPYGIQEGINNMHGNLNGTHMNGVNGTGIGIGTGHPHQSPHPDQDPYAMQSESDMNDADAMVSTEQERKILILMLLAQVCALHDSTPKTFIVHVLSLYERGILDYESIGFLFDLGLVPSPLI